jgi:hypothetical protein
VSGEACCVKITRLVVDGWQPPHDVRIELVGSIDRQVDTDAVSEALTTKWRQFVEEVGPTVAEAFQRIFIDIEEPGKAEIEDFEL